MRLRRKAPIDSGPRSYQMTSEALDALNRLTATMRMPKARVIEHAILLLDQARKERRLRVLVDVQPPVAHRAED